MLTRLSRLSLHASTAQSNSAIRSGELGLNKLSASPGICRDRGWQELQMLRGSLGRKVKSSKRLPFVLLDFSVTPSALKILVVKKRAKHEQNVLENMHFLRI